MSSTSTLSIYPPPPSCPPPPSTPQTLYPCPSPTHTIPHTFHFIWLGSPLPSVHATNIAQWQHLNPESDVVTHTDSTLHSLLPTFPLSIQLLCHNILNSDVNYGLKSDVLRYAILYQLGGVYVDCDVVPVTGFEEVMGAVGGMFAGAANVLGGGGEISNAVVGAERGHVVVENLLSSISNWWSHRIPPSLPPTSLFSSFLTPSENAFAALALTPPPVSATETFNRTGPGALTREIHAVCAASSGCEGGPPLTILPYYMLQPQPNYRRGEDYREYVDMAGMEGLTVVACHLWECSWMPKE